MTVETTNTAYQQVKDLPFANGNFPVVVTELQNFEIKDKPVSLIPVHNVQQIPGSLLSRVHQEFNHIVEEGTTYPYHNQFTLQQFIPYWFQHFVVILVEGTYGSFEDLTDDQDWDNQFLGCFYVKPNYVGRCSHVCNAGFMVNHHKRGLGLGKILGTKYLEIAPKLGYTYSVFNLVFETNVASLKIWDNLGFDRIGYVKNVAVLKGHDKLVGAIMFGKDL